MDLITEQVNQLIKKTLEMEDRRIQKEIEEANQKKTKIFIQAKNEFQKDKK